LVLFNDMTIKGNAQIIYTTKMLRWHFTSRDTVTHNAQSYYHFLAHLIFLSCKKLSRDTRLLPRLQIVLINLIFRIMYIVYIACGGFRTCTAGYVVQQLSHSNYLKQRELTGRFIGLCLEQMIDIPMGTNRAGVRWREALGYSTSEPPPNPSLEEDGRVFETKFSEAD
jgi:hypothetical protein